MSPEFVLDLGRQALLITLMLSAPMLILGLLVGVLISILQSVTQIQEMTLTFVPKIIVTMVAIIFFGPWMLRVIMAFSTQLIAQLPQLTR
jgi:flagellar biosynthetic protein FliQ